MLTTLDTMDQAALKTVTNLPHKTAANKPAEPAPEVTTNPSAKRSQGLESTERVPTMFVQAKHAGLIFAPQDAVLTIQKKAVDESASIFRESSGLLASEESTVQAALFKSRAVIKAFIVLNAQSTIDDPARCLARFEEASAELQAVDLPTMSTGLAFSQPGLARMAKGTAHELAAACRDCKERLRALEEASKELNHEEPKVAADDDELAQALATLETLDASSQAIS